MIQSKHCLSLAIGLILFSSSGLAADSHPAHRDTEERKLLQGLKHTSEFKLDQAIQSIAQLLSVNPDFKLANLLYADLLMTKAHAFNGIGGQLQSEKTRPLIEEAKQRLNHLTSHKPEQRVPANLLRLHENQEYVVVVDTSQSRLYLFKNENGAPRLTEDFYISIGKNGADKSKEGDKRTPLGVYFVNSFLSPSKLPDYYGSGAYPINYPNQWDRHLKRTGYGIWLHGNPLDSFSRPPLASDGCVTINNRDFEHLMKFIDTDGTTPVIITQNMEWTTPEKVETVRNELSDQLDKWKRDWESLDTDRYLSHYADTFSNGRQDLNQWTKNKQEINAGKTRVKVRLDKVSIFQYPGENFVLVKFLQHYASNNFKNRRVKTQYWSKQNGQWKIIYEGSAS